MELTHEIVREVFAAVSNGNCTLAKALADRGIARETFRKYVEKDFQLQVEYMAARRDAADARAEEILEIADKDPDPLRARNRIDARKWYASKLDPKVYGDRIDVNVSQRVDLTRVIEESRKRALPICDQNSQGNGEVIETTARNLDGELGQKPSETQNDTENPDAMDMLS